MRVAALYDIHGNLPALEAVLADVERAGVDRIVVGGDVFPGPMGTESLARLASLDVPVDYLFGNGERDMLASLDGESLDHLPPGVVGLVEWSAGTLDESARRRLAAWPPTVTLEVPGIGPVLFCHATPRSDREIFTRITPEVRVAPAFEGVDAALVVCGHTHMQFQRTIAGVPVWNAGSVGMPFAEPGAYWLLLDGGAQLRRTPLDVEDAAARVRASAYPQAGSFAEHNVLHPPAEDAMTAALERAAMGGG